MLIFSSSFHGTYCLWFLIWSVQFLYHFCVSFHQSIEVNQHLKGFQSRHSVYVHFSLHPDLRDAIKDPFMEHTCLAPAATAFLSSHILFSALYLFKGFLCPLYSLPSAFCCKCGAASSLSRLLKGGDGPQCTSTTRKRSSGCLKGAPVPPLLQF